jgi:outer membrane protein TolC
VADAVAREAALEAAIARADLLLTLRHGYLGASLLQRKLEILAESEKQTQDDLAKAQKKAGAGFTSRTDVREFELRLLALQEERVGLEDERDQSLAALAILAGLPRAELARMQEAWPEKAGIVSQASLEERLIMTRAGSERGAAQAQGRWPFPAFDVGLGLIQGGDRGGFLQQQDYRASAGLSLSLWDAGEASAARAALEMSAQSFDVLVDAAKLARETRADLARRRLERWLALRPQLELRVEAALQFRHSVIQEYLKGVRDGRDLEEATKASQEARNSLEEGRMTAWAAWSELQRLAAVE